MKIRNTILLLVAAAFLSMSSCSVKKVTNDVVKYAQDHFKEEKRDIDFKTGDLDLRYRADSLWDASAINGKVKKLDLCIYTMQGDIVIEVQADSTFNFNKLAELFTGLKAIKK